MLSINLGYKVTVPVDSRETKRTTSKLLHFPQNIPPALKQTLQQRPAAVIVTAVPSNHAYTSI